MPTLISVNISDGGIPKRPVGQATVSLTGLEGDEHDHEKHRTPMQAVSLIDEEDLDDLRREGFEVERGATGENFTVRGLDADMLEVGDRLVVGDDIELEITKPRNPCYVLDSISPELKHALKGRCGCYAKVIRGGTVRPGVTIVRVDRG